MDELVTLKEKCFNITIENDLNYAHEFVIVDRYDLNHVVYLENVDDYSLKLINDIILNVSSNIMRILFERYNEKDLSDCEIRFMEDDDNETSASEK